MVRPFAFLSRFKDLLPRFASPARGHFLLRQKVTKERPGIFPGPGGPAKGSGLGRMTHGPPDLTHRAGSMVGSTLIYYQRVPTDGARRLGCAGILVLCSRLPASGLLRPEARWPDKVLFSAEKSEPFGLRPAGRGWGRFWCLRRSRFAANAAWRRVGDGSIRPCVGKCCGFISLGRDPKVEVAGFFAGGGRLQGEKRKESLVDSEHFRRRQAPFPCRKRRARRL